VTKTVDPASIDHHGIGTLNHPLEGDKAHEDQRREQDEAEDVEGRPDARELPDKRERDQCARDGADEEAGSSVDVSDFLALGRLQIVVSPS
jgi:hypothetical protein